MGIGHLGISLALKKAAPRINLGLLFFVVLFADVLLGILVSATRQFQDYAGNFKGTKANFFRGWIGNPSIVDNFWAKTQIFSGVRMKILTIPKLVWKPQ